MENPVYTNNFYQFIHNILNYYYPRNVIIIHPMALNFNPQIIFTTTQVY